MKQLFTVILFVFFSFNSFAQRTDFTILPVNSFDVFKSERFINSKNDRTTAIGDTSVLSNIALHDSLVVYKVKGADSGYYTGNNIWGDMGFAERYDFNNLDSSVKIIGVIAQFSGTVNPSSTKTITIKAWHQSMPIPIASSYFYSGIPDTAYDSLVVPITQLGIGTVIDTLKTFMFSSPTVAISSSFFVGYQMYYSFNALNGDTIALACTRNGHRTSAHYNIDTTTNPHDTTVNVQNATMWADYNWHDNFTANDSISNNLAIYPIIISGSNTLIKGIKRGGFTFMGAYPIPANDYLNFNFDNNTVNEVNIEIMDLKGLIIKTLHNSDLKIGDNTISINTSNLSSGEYLYLIHTNYGEGIAGKFNKL